MQTALEAYLPLVVQGVRSQASAGKTVTRNRFGSHPVFSPVVDTAP